MNTEAKKTNIRDLLKLCSTIVSWTIFALLMICAAFLVYYFFAIKIYSAKGSGYEPKFSLYTIISPSMVPNINVYDVVVDVKVDKPEDIKINDVITFNSSLPGVNGGTVTHRVIAISKDEAGNYSYQTKGDNNLIEDGVPVPFSSIVGKVAFRIPQLGKVQSFIATKTGWIIVILIPSLYIIVKDLLKVLKIKEGENAGWFKRLLNKPLLTHKKKKLLPYTPDTNSKEADVESPIISNPTPNIYTPSSFDNEDDEFDLNDLPQLK